METVPAPSSKVKRTCDGCTASKVKCTGALPCSRCHSRGIDCFYRARKKRAVKPHEHTSDDCCTSEDSSQKKSRQVASLDSGSVSSASSAPAPPADTTKVLSNLSNNTPFLLPHEKRAWIVFFSLYKNYNAGCSRFWFERQLARIKIRLERANKLHMLASLKEWSSQMDVDFEDVQDRGAQCVKVLQDPNSRGTMLVNCGGLHLHVEGKIAHGQGNNERVFPVADPSRLRMDDLFKVSNDIAQLRMKTTGRFPEDIATVSVNPAFEKLFGISQAEMNARTQIMGSGLLPWGGDVLCIVAQNEADVFAFMQVCAINLNWNYMGRKKEEFPLIREVPSAQVIPVMTPHLKGAVPCLLRCVHSDLIDLQTGLSMELVMSFEPLMPIQMNPSSSSAANAFAQDLPVADDSDAANSVEGSSIEDEQFLNEILFPEVGMAEPDEAFLDDLLNFARTTEDLSALH